MDAKYGISEIGLDRLARDRWVAVSLLQKAVRRGELGWAVAATRALQQVDPNRLWRRLVVITVEDIGMANLELLGDVVARYRSRGRGSVIAKQERLDHLVTRIVQSPTCRATDDLMMVASYGRATERARQVMASKPLDEVAEVAATSENLSVAAVAARYCLGTDRPDGVDGFGSRRGSPHLLFDSFIRHGHFGSVAELCRDGWLASRCELFGLLPILARHWNVTDFELRSDPMPDLGTVDGVPACAVDYFTRDGRAALGRFLKGGSDAAQWINEHVSPKRRVEFAGSILFRVSSGLCRDRLIWPVGEDLREQADLFCHPGCHDAREVLDLFRADLRLFVEGLRHG